MFSVDRLASRVENVRFPGPTMPDDELVATSAGEVDQRNRQEETERYEIVDVDQIVDAWKAIFHQQLQQQPCISLVVLLLP